MAAFAGEAMVSKRFCMHQGTTVKGEKISLEKRNRPIRFRVRSFCQRTIKQTGSQTIVVPENLSRVFIPLD